MTTLMESGRASTNYVDSLSAGGDSSGSLEGRGHRSPRPSSAPQTTELMIESNLEGVTLGPLGRTLSRRDGRGPILVVDDEPSLRHAMAVALRIKGYAVETAADGDEAIRWTQDHNPSLIVLDMHMPVLDGWGFAAELRKQGHDVPILVLTTGVSEAATAAEDVGARAYLPKPFGLRDFLDAVVQIKSS